MQRFRLQIDGLMYLRLMTVYYTSLLNSTAFFAHCKACSENYSLFSFLPVNSLQRLMRMERASEQSLVRAQQSSFRAPVVAPATFLLARYATDETATTMTAHPILCAIQP